MEVCCVCTGPSCEENNVTQVATFFEDGYGFQKEHTQEKMSPPQGRIELPVTLGEHVGENLTSPRGRFELPVTLGNIGGWASDPDVTSPKSRSDVTSPRSKSVMSSEASEASQKGPRKRMPGETFHQHIDVTRLSPAQRKLVDQLFCGETGEIDVHELIAASQNYREIRNLLLIVVGIVVLCFTCTASISFAVADMTKETNVVGGVMRAYSGGDVVRTGAVQSVVGADDLPRLPRTILQELSRVTLTEMVSDVPVYHTYKISGFTLNDLTRELVLLTKVPSVSVRFRDGLIELLEVGAQSIRLVDAQTDVPASLKLDVCSFGRCTGRGTFNIPTYLATAD